MTTPFWKKDPYVKEKRFMMLLGGIMLLVLLIGLLMLWTVSP